VYADPLQTGNTIQLLPAATGRHMLHSFTGAEFGIYCDMHKSMADEFIKLLEHNLEGAQFAQVEATTSLALIEQMIPVAKLALAFKLTGRLCTLGSCLNDDGQKKCEEGCTCGKHDKSYLKPCEEGCTCGRHDSKPCKPCEEGCTCAKHDKKPCEEGCTCARHNKILCEKGCTCAKHDAKDWRETGNALKKYECGHCGAHKMSRTAKIINIVCRCGGKKQDKQPRRHKKWTACVGNFTQAKLPF